MISGREISSNLLWNLLERWGAQGVTFVVSIILARILEPSAYGVVAMASVFTAILGVFIDSGLGSALVQKKDADDYDFSTVFFFNIAMCVFLYSVVFLSAPFIAKYYGMSDLTEVIRVSSLGLIISGFKNIFVSKIQKDLQYKKFFYATLGGTIGAAVIGISMAFMGYGVWALVMQGLFNSAVDTIVLWITVGWRPKVYFSWKRLKVLFPFGIRILMTYLVDAIYNKLRDLIIGKKYSPKDLAYYNKSSGWPNLIFANIGGAVDSVMFPVMSRVQEDKIQVRNIMSQIIRTNTYVVFPVLSGLALCSEPAVDLILTEKWLPMVEYMRIFCFSFACDSIINTQMNMIRSIGRSDLFLKINVIKKSIGLFALFATMNISVRMIAYSLIFVKIFELAINCAYVKRLLDFPLIEQLYDFAPNALLCVAMAIPIVMISQVSMTKSTLLLSEIIIGSCTYILLSKIFNNENYRIVTKMVHDLIVRRKR